MNLDCLIHGGYVDATRQIAFILRSKLFPISERPIQQRELILISLKKRRDIITLSLKAVVLTERILK